MEPDRDESAVEGDPRPPHGSARAEGSASEAAGAEPSPLPSLPLRLVNVFVSPGKVMAQLADNPRWLGALTVSALLVGLAIALIPTDIFLEAQRQTMLERGGQVQEMPPAVANAMRYIIPGGAMLTVLIFTFIVAGLYTLIFAFILGDEGRYKQYLAALAHASFIPAVFGLLVTPLRISTENPQFTVNAASFFGFLSDGYFKNVLRALDLSQIWSTIVFAMGVHAIDKRRSVTSAAAIGLILALCIALIAARFM